MVLYAVRHAPTALNKENIIIGHNNPAIESYDDVIPIIKKLTKFRIKKILSSDLRRASDTAAAISKELNLFIELHKNLREVDYGQLTGMKKSEARLAYPAYHNDSSFVHPGGESFDQLQERLSKFVREVKGEEILIVTHAGCIRALFSICRGESIQKNINLKIPHDIVLICNFKKKEASLY